MAELNDPSQILIHQQLQIIQNFWQNQFNQVENGELDFKNHQLPLARIKKVMKTDEDVRAPVLFAKACEVFVLELTLRAWINTEENKRRTLQKSDISAAIAKSDMFDFLIDIVPREEFKGQKRFENPEFRQDPGFYSYPYPTQPGAMYQSNPSFPNDPNQGE